MSSLFTSRPNAPLSAAYREFPPPIKPDTPGFDFHVYYIYTSSEQAKYAKDLHTRVQSEFPELPVYRFWDKPVGPHPTSMFQIHTMTPHQTGALFGWLVVNRGPCDVFIHPNTGDTYKDHAELATWMGKTWPLNLEMLKSDE